METRHVIVYVVTLAEEMQEERIFLDLMMWMFLYLNTWQNSNPLDDPKVQPIIFSAFPGVRPLCPVHSAFW